MAGEYPPTQTWGGVLGWLFDTLLHRGGVFITANKHTGGILYMCIIVPPQLSYLVYLLMPLMGTQISF